MSSQFKTIAVVGAGALGLYYGGRLARVGSAGRVAFLARGDGEVLRRNGVTVKAPDGGFTVGADKVKIAATPEEIGPVDLVIVTLKATANDQLARMLPPLMHEGTVVLNLQNGLGVDEQVAAVAGAERTAGGLCFVCVNRIAPGVAECTMAGHVVVGAYDPHSLALVATAERLRALAEMFNAAGVKMSVSESLLEVRWRKLVWNVPFNGLAVTGGGITTDVILKSAEMEAEVWALMREVQATAAAYGVMIPEDYVVDQVERTRPMGPYKPSTMIDFVDGKPLEVEPIWGEPLRRARAKGVSTPRLEALYARLRELSAGG
ncbi:MAG: 2-dehydropantoate 2-reductase [Opitutaceae bacterium]|nr:2-dehydropantoate 2-reductase [Opitutaceae bacterium]